MTPLTGLIVFELASQWRNIAGVGINISQSLKRVCVRSAAPPRSSPGQPSPCADRMHTNCAPIQPGPCAARTHMPCSGLVRQPSPFDRGPQRRACAHMPRPPARAPTPAPIRYPTRREASRRQAINRAQLLAFSGSVEFAVVHLAVQQQFINLHTATHRLCCTHT